MMADLPQNRRAPVRIDAEDGPWSVSVAESPHDTRSYSLYIKTPTHNLTLTRTAVEIVELDGKLREAHPSAKVPLLPLDAAAIMSMPPKRKSTFLNTLSRLASPHAGKTRRLNNSSTAPSAVVSPLASPTKEQPDPFQSFTPSAITATLPTAVNSTSLASYLTTISNTPALRQARTWKRFVRVRTDDLESVRVERAIKRVRSDLAAHTGQANSGKDKDRSAPPEVEMQEPAPEHKLDSSEAQTDADKDKLVQVEPSSKQAQPPADDQQQPPPPADEEPPKSPIDGPSSRLHRSRSVDADTSARLSRVFTSSSINQDGASSQTDRETGDESSVSGVTKAKKKRSMSVDPKRKSRKVVIDDFEMMRVLGKGCAGKVLLVKHKSTTDLYALKAITKRHVLAHQELQHTLTEQAVLKRMAAESKDPFVVKLWWSFHDKENLFLVMDFHPGGDLATQLARWGRLGRDRARFYAAEIVEGVEGLHAAGVIYRDLKPENILIGGDGHIVLTDFGLSKEFPRRVSPVTAPSTPSASRTGFDTPLTPVSPPWMKVEKGGELAAGWPGQPVGQSDSTATFCGTAEYLAPEVIQGLAYSYEVDWWSFGTMLFEMLTGITPFYAGNHSDMYVRVLQDELVFPDDRALDQDTKSLIRGLLQRNPALRICEPRIKKHPYFSMIDWSHVYYKRYIPPYIPPTTNASDTQNFDETFLDMEPVLDEFVEDNEQTDTDQDADATDTDRTEETTPSQSRSSSVAPGSHSRMMEDDSVDVFDGYSFKGRHSVLVDEDEEEEEESSEDGTDEEEEEALALKGMGIGIEPGTPTVVEEEVAADTPEVEMAEPKTPEARPVVLPVEDELPSPIDSLPPAVDSPPALDSLPPTVDSTPAVDSLPPAVDSLPPLPDSLPSLADSLPPLPDSPVAPAPIELPAEPVVPALAPAARKDKPSKTVTIAEDEAAPKPRKSAEATPASAPLPAPDSEPAPGPPANKAANRLSRPPRREKSGVHALDQYLSDGGDGDAEHDDEDDDWDFVEAGDMEDRNGTGSTKAPSLFARGVVDRYRLAVFRKVSTPSGGGGGGRSVSGSSSSVGVGAGAEPESPTQRRGRNQGLTFRKGPRQFLKPKTPPSSFSSRPGTMSRSASASASGSAGGSGLVTPSLKSKQSAASVSGESDTVNVSVSGSGSGSRVSDLEGMGMGKNVNGNGSGSGNGKKLKKYKEGAEKVFSLFSPTPRVPSAQL